MLPFLKKAHDASVSAPVEPIKREPDEGAEYDSLHSAAQDLISAVKAGDVAGVADALRAAHELCEGYEDEPEPDKAA